MRNNRARFSFRILAAPVALLPWLAALLVGFEALARGDFKHAVASGLVCLLALLFTFVAFRGHGPPWLYFIFTWGQRP